MNKIVKKNYPLITPVFWVSLFITLFGAALITAVSILVNSYPDKLLGLLSTILFTSLGAFGMPMSIYLQHRNRENVFHIDDKVQGKTLIYTTSENRLLKNGEIVTAVYLHDGLIAETTHQINLLALCPKVYIDDLPEICTIEFVPDGYLNRGKTDINAITDGKHIVVETKKTNEWTANLIRHELVHVILLANKSDVNHHNVTRGLGV